MDESTHPDKTYHVEHVIAEDGKPHKHKHKHTHRYEHPKKHKGEHKMTENIYTGGGMGAGLGAGLGGGLLGGILGGALLGRGGILGGERGGEIGREVGREWVTPTQLTSALDGVTSTIQNSAIQQTLGDIKASIPFNEGQVQLALAGSTATLINQANSNHSNLIEVNNVNQTANVLGQANLKDSITAYGVANLTATKDAQYALNTAIVANADRILAAINGNEIANLNRQLTVAESRGMEDRFNARQAATTVDVTQNVNQNNLQSQAQAQQQQQQQQIGSLICAVNGLVGSHQNLQQGIVNLGTMVGNSQTAANTRVN